MVPVSIAQAGPRRVAERRCCVNFSSTEGLPAVGRLRDPYLSLEKVTSEVLSNLW